MSRSYYPVFLDLRDRRVVVVGGGEAGLTRAQRLRAVGARVTVVAADLEPDLAAMADRGEVRHVARDYRPGDLEGAWLVVAEQLPQDETAAVYREAEERRVFCCVEDDLDHVSYIHPAVVRRGDLAVAISTAGSAPVLAVRLRQELEQRLGPEHTRFLELAAAVRQPLARATPDFAERRRRWYRLVDSDVLDLLAVGDESAARGRFTEILGATPETPTFDSPSSEPPPSEPQETAP